MKKMNTWEESWNKQIGEACRQLRKRNLLTQAGLAKRLTDFYDEKLKSMGFSNEERDQFFHNMCDKNLAKKLRNKGINPDYHTISASTISSYENGNSAIPAYYVELLKEIFGDFKI